jgi:predicted metal-dependent hydrolase
MAKLDITAFIRRIFSVRRSHFDIHKENARQLIHQRLKHFAPLCGVVYKRVSIRNQRRRWGSCSSLGNLNFNYRLIFLPRALCDYVIVHELCHLKQMNHGPNFWAEVEKVLPNYLELEAELKIIEKSRGAYLKTVPQSVLMSSYYEAEVTHGTSR